MVMIGNPLLAAGYWLLVRAEKKSKDRRRATGDV
jgi:hypothetical protein